VARFHAWCAACHLSAEQFPPNFLSGPGAELEARIRQCAPRIFVRLAMARRAPADREKTPMPPDTMLPAFGSDAAAWAMSPERAALENVVATLLKAETGHDPDPDAMLARGYEALRPCLAGH
jgi:mono/diheme cytochrome c family protein